MNKVIKKVLYVGVTFLIGYICWNYSSFIASKLKWYQWGKYLIDALAFFATMGGFYLSVRAITKVAEIEESFYRKSINLGYYKSYEMWFNEYNQSKEFHSKILNDLRNTVKLHIEHTGYFKRQKLKKELKILDRHINKAEKKKEDTTIIIKHEIEAFMKISKLYSEE